jgi:hypothetical protein
MQFPYATIAAVPADIIEQRFASRKSRREL